MTEEIKTLQRLVTLNTFRAADKEAARVLLLKYGVEEPSKRSCPSCWRDACVMALREARKYDMVDDTLPRLRGNAAVNGVWFKGRYVSNDIMDDELAEWMEENGFPSRLLET